MSNDERAAFEAEWMARRADDEGNPAPKPLRSLYDHEQYRGSGANGSWVWFQRGAAYQRQQVKGLVEALEKISALTTHSAIQHWADEALAAYKAAQEGK